MLSTIELYFVNCYRNSFRQNGSVYELPSILTDDEACWADICRQATYLPNWYEVCNYFGFKSSDDKDFYFATNLRWEDMLNVY